MDAHNVTDIAAIVTTDVVDEEFPEDGYLLIVVWRGCSMRIVFPDGSRMDVKAPTGVDLDAFIDIAIAMIHQCCSDTGREDLPQITVHRAPAGVTTEEEILAWVQSVPGFALDFGPPEGTGFGGPLPPPGQAG